MSEKRKKNFRLSNSVIVYILIMSLIAFLIFPTVANCVAFPLFKISKIEGFAFLNYRVFFQSTNHIQVLISMTALWLVAMIYWWTKASGGSKGNAGNEHGTARWLSDDEFDDLIPWYIFRRNEQDYREEPIQKKFEILKTSNVDVFEDMEFESKYKEDKNNG